MMMFSILSVNTLQPLHHPSENRPGVPGHVTVSSYVSGSKRQPVKRSRSVVSVKSPVREPSYDRDGFYRETPF